MHLRLRGYGVDFLILILINIFVLPLVMSIYWIGLFGFILRFKILGESVLSLYPVIGGWVMFGVVNIQLLIAMFFLGPLIILFSNMRSRAYCLIVGFLYSCICSLYYCFHVEMSFVVAISSFFSGLTAFYIWRIFTRKTFKGGVDP